MENGLPTRTTREDGWRGSESEEDGWLAGRCPKWDYTFSITDDGRIEGGRPTDSSTRICFPSSVGLIIYSCGICMEGEGE